MQFFSGLEARNLRKVKQQALLLNIIVNVFFDVYTHIYVHIVLHIYIYNIILHRICSRYSHGPWGHLGPLFPHAKLDTRDCAIVFAN